MAIELNPEVKQQLLIRVPAEAVYNAFANPEITTQFWFSHSDGRLRQVLRDFGNGECSVAPHVLT